MTTTIESLDFSLSQQPPFRGVTFAISKGRILNETLPILKAAGIELSECLSTTRKLIIGTNSPDIRLLVLRASDVPVFVSEGAADIGVVGKDVLMEYCGSGLSIGPTTSLETRLLEVLDLKIAKCKLMVARLDHSVSDTTSVQPCSSQKGLDRGGSRLKVATKFVNIAREYYALLGQQVDIVKLYGSMELAPLVGLADKIVDVVDTGNTLRANGLVAEELIAHVSSRLIVNKTSIKLQHTLLNTIIERMSESVK